MSVDSRTRARGISQVERVLRGTSRNPDYNIAQVTHSRFGREHGKRVAPIAQLNTKFGRKLAQPRFAKNTPRTEGIDRSIGSEYTQHKPIIRSARPTILKSQPQQADNESSGASTDVSIVASCPSSDASNNVQTGHESMSDREHLPSQKSRTASSAFLGITRGGSPKKIYKVRNKEQTEDQRQVEYDQPKAAQDLYEEFLQYQTPCAICGYMSNVTSINLIACEGKSGNLVNGIGKTVRNPSGELRDWCIRVASTVRSIANDETKNSMGEGTASYDSTTAKRPGSSDETQPTRKQSSGQVSAVGTLPHPGVPVTERQSGLRVKRQFSFDMTDDEEYKAFSNASLHTKQYPKQHDEKLISSNLLEQCRPVNLAGQRHNASQGSTDIVEKRVSNPQRPFIARTFSEMGL